MSHHYPLFGEKECPKFSAKCKIKKREEHFCLLLV